jgi:hypothetical protein
MNSLPLKYYVFWLLRTCMLGNITFFASTSVSQLSRGWQFLSSCRQVLSVSHMNHFFLLKPFALQWSIKRRFELAGLLSSILRAHLQAYDPILSMILRYLIRYLVQYILLSFQK